MLPWWIDLHPFSTSLLTDLTEKLLFISTFMLTCRCSFNVAGMTKNKRLNCCHGNTWPAWHSLQYALKAAPLFCCQSRCRWSDCNLCSDCKRTKRSTSSSRSQLNLNTLTEIFWCFQGVWMMQFAVETMQSWAFYGEILLPRIHFKITPVCFANACTPHSLSTPSIYSQYAYKWPSEPSPYMVV